MKLQEPSCDSSKHRPDDFLTDVPATARPNIDGTASQIYRSLSTHSDLLFLVTALSFSRRLRCNKELAPPYAFFHTRLHCTDDLGFTLARTGRPIAFKSVSFRGDGIRMRENLSLFPFTLHSLELHTSFDILDGFVNSLRWSTSQ
jgi:hypothetical protein